MKKLIVLILIILNISACANNSDESLSQMETTNKKQSFRFKPKTLLIFLYSLS